MSETKVSAAAFADTKPHYEHPRRTARRGGADRRVAFHVFEAYCDKALPTRVINHGYLAVDFFFVLSGFVIGYAYDDRWNRMSLKGASSSAA